MGGESGGQAGGKSGGSAGGGGPGSTGDERRAAIDRKLDESIGTLDREVRKEQQKTSQERDARAASNAGNGSGDGNSEEGKDGSDVSGGTAKTEGPNDGSGKPGAGRSSRPGDLKSEKQQKKGEGNTGSAGGGAGSGAPQGSGSGASEIPDGSDDDIVARRLRKAAEAETDPELKEKLWKEYIEYKKGASK
jgi:hypothetical protein